MDLYNQSCFKTPCVHRLTVITTLIGPILWQDTPPSIHPHTIHNNHTIRTLIGLSPAFNPPLA